MRKQTELSVEVGVEVTRELLRRAATAAGWTLTYDGGRGNTLSWEERKITTGNAEITAKLEAESADSTKIHFEVERRGLADPFKLCQGTLERLTEPFLEEVEKLAADPEARRALTETTEAESQAGPAVQLDGEELDALIRTAENKARKKYALILALGLVILIPTFLAALEPQKYNLGPSGCVLLLSGIALTLRGLVGIVSPKTADSA